MAEHPITPPPSAIDYLNRAVLDGRMDQWDSLEAAYRAGADAELEACCEWLVADNWKAVHKLLRAARRPKPPSVAEEALRILVENSRTFGGCVQLDLEDVNTICHALKRLQELENNG